jgi:ABC-type transporter MlaC component
MIGAGNGDGKGHPVDIVIIKRANNGYKVTNLIVDGINMASMQHSDVVSVIQRHSGHMPALLVALREKNASNGILR